MIKIIKYKYRFLSFIVSLATALFAGACSMNEFVINRAAGALTGAGGGTVFTGDDDPELIADSLPLMLKLHESLLAGAPDNYELFIATGKNFVIYSNAFIHTPASMLSDSEAERKDYMMNRAKKMYLRGRKYILEGIELKYAGFTAALEKGQEKGDYSRALSGMGKDDVPSLYWGAAAWMAAFSIDAFDVSLGATIPRAAAMMEKALELDETFADGSIHDFYISYYGALPAVMGGSEKKARDHFDKAVKFSRGLKLSPYVALATTVSVKNQDLDEFRDLLGRALEIDIDKSPDNRLANIISRRKAEWFLNNIDSKFLISGEEDE